MSVLAYFGLLAVSTSWLWMLYLYLPPRIVWLPMLLLGVVCLSFANRKDRETGERTAARRLSPSAGLLLVPVAAAAAILPRPLNVGPIVLLVSLAAGILAGDGGGRFRPVRAGLIAGSALTVQALALPLLAAFSAHYHEVPLLGYLIAPFVRLFDVGATSGGGSLFLSNPERWFGLTVSWEKLALIPIVLYFASVLVYRLFAAVRGSLVRLALVFIAYAAARIVAVLFALVLTDADRLLWAPHALLLSLAPLPLALAWLAPVSPPLPPDGGGEERARGSLVRGVAWAAAAALLVAGAVLYHDPGVKKGGRLLFDEHYSNWEWSTKPYDRDWYGQRSGYNYYCLAEYLGTYYDLERGKEPLSPAYLARFDVVIIKTPTRPFTPAEVEMLDSWVRAGGGLFLIGDHTNVFGTSTYLNPIAERFGLRFNYDSTYQLGTMALSYWVPPPYVSHPVARYVPNFLFATSCTIDGPLFGEQAIIGYALRGIYLDYSQRSFFPTKEEKEYQFGLLLQMAGAKVGKGRVLGFTDSTVFSNFFMFSPGKPELFISSVDWLNRVNLWRWLNLVLFIAGLAATAVAWAALRGRPRLAGAGAALGGILLGTAIALPLFDALTGAAYPLPRPVRAQRRIAFDLDPSRIEMPVRHLVAKPGTSLHTFYVWTQRLGMIPSLHERMSEALAAAPIAVVANPERSFATAEIDSIIDFCRRGGSFLLIVDPRNEKSSADELLGIVRMRMAPDVVDSTSVLNMKGERICKALGAGTLEGGVPLLALQGGGAVLAAERIGSGRFYAFADFAIFSEKVMGPTSIEPDRARREIYELEFQLLEVLMGNRPADGIAPLPAPAAKGAPRTSRRSPR